MELNVLHNSRVQELSRTRQMIKLNKPGPKSRRSQGQSSMPSDDSSDTGEDTTTTTIESQNNGTDSDNTPLRSTNQSRVEKVGGQTNKLSGPLSKQKQRQSMPEKLPSELQSEIKKGRGRAAQAAVVGNLNFIINYTQCLKKQKKQDPLYEAK